MSFSIKNISIQALYCGYFIILGYYSFTQANLIETNSLIAAFMVATSIVLLSFLIVSIIGTKDDKECFFNNLTPLYTIGTLSLYGFTAAYQLTQPFHKTIEGASGIKLGEVFTPDTIDERFGLDESNKHHYTFFDTSKPELSLSVTTNNADQVVQITNTLSFNEYTENQLDTIYKQIKTKTLAQYDAEGLPLFRPDVFDGERGVWLDYSIHSKTISLRYQHIPLYKAAKEESNTPLDDDVANKLNFILKGE